MRDPLAIVAAIGLVVVTVLNSLALLYTVRPASRPDEPVSEVEAVVQTVTLETGSLLEYDHRFGAGGFTDELRRTFEAQPQLRAIFPGRNDEARARAAAGNELGVIAFAEVSTRGLDLGTPSFYLVDAQTRRRVAGPPSIVAQVLRASPDRTRGRELLRIASTPQFEPRVRVDRQVAVAFLACNATLAQVLVRVEVQDLSEGDNPVRADIADSLPIVCPFLGSADG